MAAGVHSANAALNELVEAFPPHALDPAHAFDEWGATYVDYESFEREVRGKRWNEVPATFWEFHHDALFFLGPSVMPDYLPGYLAAVVRREAALSALPGFLLEALTRREGERFDERFSRLTSPQRRAVRSALLVLETELTGDPRAAVSAALDSYWREESA